MKKWIAMAGVALALFACAEGSNAPTELAPDNAQLVKGPLVYTPSGAVFTQAEWAAKKDKTPWLETMDDRIARTGTREQAEGLHMSVSGLPAPKVLCHYSAYICGVIPGLIPGTQITYWNYAQWTAATTAQFAQFDVIYIPDGAGGYPEFAAKANVYGAAVTGRAALTGVHYEHCGGNPNDGPCRVLKASIQWIHAGQGTGLLSATQYINASWLPNVPPFTGVSYSYNGGGFDLVRITDPGHATMQGSTDASLSNFFNSAHSIFGTIGGFTSVAEICDRQGTSYPGNCSSGTWRPNFLVTSGAFADQDGDGVGDSADNCPTVGNANQADANNNGVGDVCESAPTVSIAPATNTIASGASVTFTATAADSDNPLSSLTYEWRVNGIVQGGATSSTFTKSFTADATVRVTVRDPGNLSGFAEASVKIGAINVPPVANAGSDQTLYRTSAAGVSASLNGTGSTDADGTISSYDWSENGSSIATGATPSVMLGLGSHSITLKVTDDKGATHTDVVVINVRNVAPTANAGADQSHFRTSASGASVTLNGSGSSDVDGSVASYAWSVNGSDIGSSSTLQHVFGLGTHQVRLEVTDNDGATHSDIVEIEINNVAPVANAGADQSEFRTSAAGVDIMLNGAASSDLDGTVSSYQWSENGVVIANGANPTHTFTLGTHNVNLEVTDNNGATHNDMMVVTVKNVAPFARAGSNQTLECVNGGAVAQLDGSASFDLDGTVSYLWTTGATTATTSKVFGLGTTTVGLTVTDNNGEQDSDNVDITVQDSKNPTISLSISAPSIWPPNHKMVKVASGISASDGCDSSLNFAVAVSSNEPVNGTGDGDTAPDWDIVRNANGTYDVWVRAERSGGGSGRIYTITATSTDGTGNTFSKTGTVTVAHDQGKK